MEISDKKNKIKCMALKGHGHLDLKLIWIVKLQNKPENFTTSAVSFHIKTKKLLMGKMQPDNRNSQLCSKRQCKERLHNKIIQIRGSSYPYL